VLTRTPEGLNSAAQVRVSEARAALVVEGRDVELVRWPVPGVEQLDRMSRMVTDNTAGFQQAIAADFKTARQEYDFETSTAIAEAEFQKSQLQAWMEPVEAPVPRALAATGHKAMIYREPYGVTLVIGPFNGPLTLLIRPAIAVLAAGNTCILKPSEALTATSALLARLVPEYFDPRAVCVVAADREKGSQLLDLPRPLAAYAFSRDQTRIDRLPESSPSG
jgi:aldehyde dehydrogenase (NAD+)